MTESLLIIVFSGVFVLLVALAFLYMYFRSRFQEVQEEWVQILRKLRLRMDKIPNLVETVRAYVKDEAVLIDNLVSARSELWPLERAEAERVHAELRMSEMLHQMWALAGKSSQLAADVNFLELKTEVREVNEQIEQSVEKYNEKVRHVNKQTRLFLWRPVVRLLGFKHLPVFEFEG